MEATAQRLAAVTQHAGTTPFAAARATHVLQQHPGHRPLLVVGLRQQPEHVTHQASGLRQQKVAECSRAAGAAEGSRRSRGQQGSSSNRVRNWPTQHILPASPMLSCAAAQRQTSASPVCNAGVLTSHSCCVRCLQVTTSSRLVAGDALPAH
jgi:hypothetical protein